ncbi:MAG: hypothetical protein U5K43_09640 [Halofilum sp. (in: g-proteobacteria)]|nr:hypothetical protein [Halofilum sp. (in: g-proteobacteria)]
MSSTSPSRDLLIDFQLVCLRAQATAPGRPRRSSSSTSTSASRSSALSPSCCCR